MWTIKSGEPVESLDELWPVLGVDLGDLAVVGLRLRGKDDLGVERGIRRLEAGALDPRAVVVDRVLAQGLDADRHVWRKNAIFKIEVRSLK